MTIWMKQSDRPQSCIWCPVMESAEGLEWYCPLAKEQIYDKLSIHKNCPIKTLPDNHGDLIDFNGPSGLLEALKRVSADQEDKPMSYEFIKAVGESLQTMIPKEVE